MVYAMHLMLEPFLHYLIVQLLHVKASHWKMKDIFWLGVTHHWGFQWKYSPFPWIVTNFFVTKPRRWKRKGWTLPLQLSVRFFRLEVLTHSLTVMLYFLYSVLSDCVWLGPFREQICATVHYLIVLALNVSCWQKRKRHDCFFAYYLIPLHTNKKSKFKKLQLLWFFWSISFGWII